MIDGLKLSYRINDFEAWKRAVKIELFTPTDKDTGAIKEKRRHTNGILQSTITYRGNFETYQITIKEIQKTFTNCIETVIHYFSLDGSLHKNHFAGANYLPLTWDELQKQISHLETRLQLTGENSELVNLEIGVNVLLPFPVFPFLQKNLISYKGNTFNRYNPDKNGICLGFVCMLSQYSVKIYDKGKQFNLQENVMRFELRFIKMQKLNKKKIKTLSDLKDIEKVNALLGLLLAAWENVLLFDSSINLNSPGLKPREKELLQNGCNPKYWEQLKETDNRRFNYEREKFKLLVASHGKNVHEKIKELIKSEWQNLFKNCTILPTAQNPELYEFTIKIKGKNEQKRFCLSCGRDISNQNKRSKFCSGKFVGESAAHKCRNKDSNPRNNFKKKIETINRRGVLFDVIPFIIPIEKNNKIQSYAI